jgi:hypothetical protein
VHTSRYLLPLGKDEPTPVAGSNPEAAKSAFPALFWRLAWRGVGNA